MSNRDESGDWRQRPKPDKPPTRLYVAEPPEYKPGWGGKTDQREPWERVTAEQVEAWFGEDFTRGALKPRIAACLTYISQFRRRDAQGPR